MGLCCYPLGLQRWGKGALSDATDRLGVWRPLVYTSGSQPTWTHLWELIFQPRFLSLGSPEILPVAKSNWKPESRGVCWCSQHWSASQDIQQAGEGCQGIWRGKWKIYSTVGTPPSVHAPYPVYLQRGKNYNIWQEGGRAYSEGCVMLWGGGSSILLLIWNSRNYFNHSFWPLLWDVSGPYSWLNLFEDFCSVNWIYF